MNYKKKYIKLFILLLQTISFHHISAVLTMSQYKPDSYLQKPYFTQDYFTQFSCYYSGGFANSAYNDTGKKVPFLQQFGTENLLKKFVDTNLPSHNTESFAQANLSGNFHVKELILSCYKNMQQGFFIEAATALQDLLINSIHIDLIENLTPLTQEQIAYVDRLHQILPQTLNQSGMFTTAFYAGFHKTFSEFKHFDFIDLQIKAGITSPQAMSKNNYSLLQFPYIPHVNFGYPIIATTTVGLLDWITLGLNGAIIPWQAATTTLAMNSSSTQNILLMDQSYVGIIKRGPLFTGSIYFEADHFHQNLSTLVAYCYTRNSAYTIIPIDKINTQITQVNQSPLVNPWSLSSIYIECSIDFACESQPNAPIVALFCNIPIAGHLCPETNIFGGAYSLQLSYAF